MVPILVGATASGKTELLASLFGPGAPFEGQAEIVSADSMQAYRGMDIGTAKPPPILRESLPHHLIDIRDPREQYTVGDFVRLAKDTIGEILSRGRLPIVSGGTGFYIKNLVLGLPTSPPADPEIRAAVARDLASRGPEGLRAELAVADPLSARRIHPNDLYRLSRALEITRATGRPLADFLSTAGGGGGGGCFSWLIIEYRLPRDEQRSRIARRVDAMFEAGLPAELAALRQAGYKATDPGMKAIGYSEFFELAATGMRGAELLAAARERIKLDTLRYAKRQATFFRGLPGIVPLASGPGASAAFYELLRSDDRTALGGAL